MKLFLQHDMNYSVLLAWESCSLIPDGHKQAFVLLFIQLVSTAQMKDVPLSLIDTL